MPSPTLAGGEIRLPKPPWYLRLLSLKVVIPAVLAMLLFLAPFVNRAWHLRLMPRIEEPFDQTELESIQIPDTENAFTHYHRAEKLSVSATEEERKARDRALEEGWREPSPELEGWLQRWEPALAEYRAGSKLERAQAVPLSEQDWIFGIPDIGTSGEIGHVLVILACRHQARGEPLAAWECWHELLRVSRHIGQYGGHLERLVGQSLFSQFANQMPAWAAEPALTTADLREAIDHLQEAWKLTAPASRTLRIEYCSDTNTVSRFESGSAGYTWNDFPDVPEPAGVLLYVQGEPELGKRVLRFYYQNWLRYVDLPPYQRPPLDTAGLLFAEPAGLMVDGRVLSLAEYQQGLDRSPVASFLIPATHRRLNSSDRETVYYRITLCLLAAHAYYRDHHRFPDRLADLVPGYLEEIPVDPYDGKSLKYRPDPDQPAIYSVYLNRWDDGGGIVRYEDPGKPSDEPPDLGFRLQTPRRQAVIAPQPVLE